MTQSNVIKVKIDFLRKHLDDNGLSEKEFAEIIGVSHSTVNRILNGKRHPGGKFVTGVLSNFNSLSFDEVFSYDISLPKGNDKQIV